MSKRTELQTMLEDVLGSSNVYFQPPENIKIVYPCIVYVRSAIDTKFANDILYKHKVRYLVTHITKDPDSLTNEKILSLPFCSFVRHHTSNNLNHDIFNIYY